MQSPVATPDPPPAQLRVNAATSVEVAAAPGSGPGDAVVTLTIDTGSAGSIQFTGTCWTLHRLIIDLDRRLTRLARQVTLPPHP